MRMMSPMTRLAEPGYFEWLCGQIEIVGKAKRTYDGLFGMLYATEFEWTVSGDDNRVQDGLDLRGYFSGGRPYRFPEFVTVLEVLIGLSRQLAFIAGGEAPAWAWQLIENIGFADCSDPLTFAKGVHIKENLANLVHRQYGPDGSGGFFPLQDPREDQAQIEIWKQLHSYVNEIQEPI
jgi:hypothetical protein